MSEQQPPESSLRRRVWGSGNSSPRINYNLPGWKKDTESIERLWTLYLDTVPTVKEDAGRWKGDTDGILIFTGLFSAMVAAFIIESYKNLSPDPQSATALILAQISKQLATIGDSTPAGSQLSSGISVSTTELSVRVNVLWVFSLFLSVTCALFAVMAQQWIRRFQRICDRRSHDGLSSEALARTRLHVIPMAKRLENFITGLQQDLHLAVLLFFAGLVKFFWSINLSVAKTVLAMTIILSVFYVSYTLESVSNEPTSLFQTPLTGVIYRTFQLIRSCSKYVRHGNFSGLKSVLKHLGWNQHSLRDLWRDTIVLLYLSRYSDLDFDDALASAIHDRVWGDNELQALVWLFQRYRDGTPEELQRSAGTCMTGLCNILAMEHSFHHQDERENLPTRVRRPLTILVSLKQVLLLQLRDSQYTAVPVLPRLITSLFEANTQMRDFDSWESWLVHISRTCDPSAPVSVHFTVMCFCLHWHVLCGPISLPTLLNSLVVSGDQFTGDRPSVELYDTLQRIREHFSAPVAIAARCLQARVAAGLEDKWATAGLDVTERDEALFWDFVSIPNALVQRVRENPAIYAASHNRAPLIIIALVEDTLEAINMRTIKKKLLRLNIEPVLKTMFAIQACILPQARKSAVDELGVRALQTYFDDLSASDEYGEHGVCLKEAFKMILANLSQEVQTTPDAIAAPRLVSRADDTDSHVLNRPALLGSENHIVGVPNRAGRWVVMGPFSELGHTTSKQSRQFEMIVGFLIHPDTQLFLHARRRSKARVVFNGTHVAGYFDSAPIAERLVAAWTEFCPDLWSGITARSLSSGELDASERSPLVTHEESSPA